MHVGVHRENPGYTAVEKQVIRPAAFTNERACKSPILLFYSACRGCITVAHAQIEHTIRSLVPCRDFKPIALRNACGQHNAAFRGPICSIQNSHGQTASGIVSAQYDVVAWIAIMQIKDPFPCNGLAPEFDQCNGSEAPIALNVKRVWPTV